MAVSHRGRVRPVALDLLQEAVGRCRLRVPLRRFAVTADEPSGTSGEGVPEDEETPQEWADGVAATIGSIFKHNHPSGKDW